MASPERFTLLVRLEELTPTTEGDQPYGPVAWKKGIPVPFRKGGLRSGLRIATSLTNGIANET